MTASARSASVLGIAVLAALLLPATPALARGELLRGFDDEFFRFEDSSIRNTWFQRTSETGASLVRIPVFWRSVATTEPANPSDPADPAYDFRLADQAIAEAQAHGLTVMIQVVHAPDWAEGPGAPSGADPGTWKPDPDAFRFFAEAIGRRYSGQYSPPPGLPIPSDPLPEVDYFEVWNEPNLSGFLAPQWEGKRPEGAIHYRKLLNAFYDGVKVAHPAAQVVAGATAPYGDPGHPRLGRMRPLAFLREVLCLKRQGTARCPVPPKLDLLAHHPISLSGGPKRSAIHRDDAATADFHEVVELLRRAERAGTVLPSGRRRDAWADEFWWLSDPPGGAATVPLDTQARWVQSSMYELWKQGADAAIYYQLIDKANSNGAERAAGLYFADGRAKPSLRAFRFPFVIERTGGKRVRAWTISPASGTLTIETRSNGDWREVKSLQVDAGSPEQTKVRVDRESRAVIGGEASLIWRSNR